MHAIEVVAPPISTTVTPDETSSFNATERTDAYVESMKPETSILLRFRQFLIFFNNELGADPTWSIAESYSPTIPIGA